MRLRAMAKINLGLDVLRKREDGYHEVRMIMQTIQMYDLLDIRKKSEPGIILSTNLPYVPSDERNLVYKAAKLLMDEFEVGEGLSMKLTKSIPVAAGMAGGSSDAAAAFVGVNRLFRLGLSEEELMKRAVQVGADVPYCVMRGTALAEGIGEKLTSLPGLPRCYVLVGKPGINVSTKLAYENLNLNSEMVAEILQYFSDDLRLRNIEADCLYAGIMIDTNNFITRAGVRTFEAAAFLRRSGADMTRVRKMLRDNIDSYKARAEAVRTAEIYRGCFAIAQCPSKGLESPTVVGAQAANELLNIAGVKASFVLTPYNKEVYVSARAIDEVNVQVMMEKLGGGGHINIAGAQVRRPMDEVEDMIKEIIDEMYQEEETKK